VVIEIVFGVILLSVGSFVFAGSQTSQQTWAGTPGSVGLLLGIVILTFGLLDVLAAILVFRRSNAGRLLAIVMCAIGGAGGVYSLARSGGAGGANAGPYLAGAVTGTAVRILVVVMLVRNAAWFRQSRETGYG